MEIELKEVTTEEIVAAVKKYQKKVEAAIKKGFCNFVLCEKTVEEKAIASLLILLRLNNPQINVFMPLSSMDVDTNYEYFKLFLCNDDGWDWITVQISTLKDMVVCCTNPNVSKSEQIVDNLKKQLKANVKALNEF